jgi:nicotinamidase-related amidase
VIDLHLSRARAALLVVDIQERLLPAMPEDVAQRVIKNACILIDAARRLGLPIVVSEQYPKGLGATVQPIEAALADAAAAGAKIHRFDKLEFSAAASPKFAELPAELRVVVPEKESTFASKLSHAGKALEQLMQIGRRDQWIVCGMESHVCVYQTVRDLVGTCKVHVVADAVCSRTKANWKLGLELAQSLGAAVTSTEVVVFDLLERAGSEEFKALSKAIK